MTRPIRPHKGGRICRAPDARMTPRERDRLDAVLQRRGVKYINWFIGHVEADYAEITGENEMGDRTQNKMEIKFAAAWVKRACAEYGIKATWFRVLNYDTEAKGDLVEVGNTKRTKVLTNGDRATFSM